MIEFERSYRISIHLEATDLAQALFLFSSFVCMSQFYMLMIENIIMMVVSHFAQAIDVYQYSSHYITRLKTFDLNFAYPHLDM